MSLQAYEGLVCKFFSESGCGTTNSKVVVGSILTNLTNPVHVVPNLQTAFGEPVRSVACTPGTQVS
jgi:hypothetical protein